MPLEPGDPDAALLLSAEGELDLARAARRLAVLHGLPPREAQLAAAMAAGQSIAEAGAAMGLTLETARNYSKRIYARLGVSGQPALCAKVWRGVAMLP
nr:LuxR C-terminal-related transcriptional regulator [Novosphingobium sp. 9]